MPQGPIPLNLAELETKFKLPSLTATQHQHKILAVSKPRETILDVKLRKGDSIRRTESVSPIHEDRNLFPKLDYPKLVPFVLPPVKAEDVICSWAGPGAWHTRPLSKSIAIRTDTPKASKWPKNQHDGDVQHDSTSQLPQRLAGRAHRAKDVYKTGQSSSTTDRHQPVLPSSPPQHRQSALAALR
jgi:hypothetical protein